MLKGGIIGLGRMGITHLSILNTHPSVRFIALCDSSKFMRRNLSEQLNISLFSDYHEMIDKSDLDFVIIATPTSSHAGIVKYAIQNNLHVFAEKPFVLRSQDGEEIVDVLSKGLVNQAGYVNRFNEVFVKVKEHMDRGLIGDLCHFRFEVRAATVLKSSNKSWRTQTKEGGGCLHELGSHVIDLINYIVGPPDNISGSFVQKIYSSDVEDAVCSTFTYKKGFSGNLLANWSDVTCRKPMYQIELLGKNGKIIANQHDYRAYLRIAEKTLGFQEGWNIRHITDFAQPVRFYVRGNEFTRQLDYFINCIINKKTENRCSLAEALVTDRIIERIAEDCGQSST